MKKNIFLMVLLFAFATLAAGPKSYTVKLTGSEIVPPVETKATGEVAFTPDGKELKYRISAQGLQNVSGIHIHMGKKGQDGPPVAMILHGKKPGDFGTLDGKITKKDLAGKLKGKDIQALLQMMDKGETYVNIHTDSHPKGELRGQIE